MMTDTRIDSLVWGCILSIMLHVHGTVKRLSWLLGYTPVAIALLSIIAGFLMRDESFRQTVRFSLQGMALFTLFLNLFYTDKFSWLMPILEWKPLAWIGTMSYGLYLWHVPIIDMCHRYVGEGPLVYALALPLSFYIVAFSYYIIEKNFLTLRKNFGSHIIIKVPA